MRRQCQPVGQQHGVGRLIEPAAQGRVIVQAILLAQRMFAVAGDTQHLHQFTLFVEQQFIALLNPDRQTPGLDQRIGDFQQAHAKQLLLDEVRRFAFVDDPQLPFLKQLRKGQR